MNFHSLLHSDFWTLGRHLAFLAHGGRWRLLSLFTCHYIFWWQCCLLAACGCLCSNCFLFLFLGHPCSNCILLLFGWRAHLLSRRFSIQVTSWKKHMVLLVNALILFEHSCTDHMDQSLTPKTVLSKLMSWYQALLLKAAGANWKGGGWHINERTRTNLQTLIE